MSDPASPLFQKLVARIGEVDRELEIAPDGEAYRVRHAAGEELVEWQELPGGRVLLRVEGRPVEARMTRTPDGSCRIEWRGRVFLVRVEDDLGRRARIAQARHSGPVPLRSPMPGMVLRVLVEEGQVVTSDQPVLILEAMKMQNEISAPVGGTIVELTARAGQAVEADAVLLRVRP